MHLAAAEGMEQAVELLLERGACPLALDSWGRTPQQVARADALLIARLVHAQAEGGARGAGAGAVSRCGPRSAAERSNKQ